MRSRLLKKRGSMTKIAKTALLTAALLLLTACAEVERKEPVDSRFIPAHTEQCTDYKYVYDWANGKFRLMPEIGTRYVEDAYEICYKVTYDNGKVYERWEEVEKEVYDEYKKE